MKQRPYPTPPPARYAQPYTPPPRPEDAATLPLPRLTRGRLLWHDALRARWWIHVGCAVAITTGAAAVNAPHPDTWTRVVAIAFVITGSGTSGYHLRNPRP